DEPLAGYLFGGGAGDPCPVGDVRVAVDEGVAVRAGELFERAEILVVAATARGQERMHRVMEVVGPLRVEAVAMAFPRLDHLPPVQTALGDQVHVAPQLGGPALYRLRQLLKEVFR